MFMNDRKDFNIAKMSVLHNLIHFVQMQSKLQEAILWILTDSKVYIKRQKTQNSQHNIEGEKQSWTEHYSTSKITTKFQ